MRKLTLLFAALTLSAGLWAFDDIKYIDADGVEQTANNVTVITDATTTLTEGWYLVIQANTSTLVCTGAVHLILFDGANLTATGSDKQPGIQVSGDGNSLTIYGQNNQTGQLIATGGNSAAGIGGGELGSGSNITINGGKVTATGGDNAAGIGGGESGSGSNITINGGEVTATGGFSAAGIGGGESGAGYNITINGGKVTANGGWNVAGIGGGQFGFGSDIFVATTHIVKADGNNPPTTEIATNRTATTDIASDLAGNRYVTIELDLTPIKAAAIDAIDAAVEGVTDEYIAAIAADAKTKITNAETTTVINSVKTFAMAKINAIKEIIAATKDLTLFSAEESYINLIIKSSIQQDDDVNLINGDKQLGLDYIALHDAKSAAVAAVRHDMGDYAESEAIYNLIGGPAIEAAMDSTKIAEAKNAALAKLEEFSEVLGEASIAGYNKGKEDGIEEALGEMAEPCTDCPAVEVTKGSTTIKLYNPESVEFKKVAE